MVDQRGFENHFNEVKLILEKLSLSRAQATSGHDNVFSKGHYEKNYSRYKFSYETFAKFYQGGKMLEVGAGPGWGEVAVCRC